MVSRTDASNSEELAAVVFIVEDHRLLADALVSGLAARGFRGVVADLAGEQAVIDQAVQTRPAVILLDLDLGVCDGLDLIPVLRASGAGVLVVTGCRDHLRLASAVALGAVGWVSKARPFEELLEATECAASDRPFFEAAHRDEVTRVGRVRLAHDHEVRSRVARLTPREREVLCGITDGMSARELAADFVVSLGTIRTHIQAILMKLGVTSQLSAAAVVRQFAASRRGADPDEISFALPSSQYFGGRLADDQRPGSAGASSAPALFQRTAHIRSEDVESRRLVVAAREILPTSNRA